MTAMIEGDQDEPECSCRAAVDRLFSRYEIRILPCDTFVQLAIEALRSGIAPSPAQAAFHIYALALFVACSGGKTTAAQTAPEAELLQRVAGFVISSPARAQLVQEQGFTELYRFLYDSARWRYPDLCEDAAQTALGEIYRSLDHCRIPGAFLKFAIYRLVSTATSLLRHEAQTAESLDLSIATEEGLLPLGNLLPAGTQSDPLEVAVNETLRAQFACCLAECMRRHPQARFQLVVVWMKYIEGLDDAVIKERLNKSANSIYTARSRGLKLLAGEPSIRALAEAFGLNVTMWSADQSADGTEKARQ